MPISDKKITTRPPITDPVDFLDVRKSGGIKAIDTEGGKQYFVLDEHEVAPADFDLLLFQHSRPVRPQPPDPKEEDPTLAGSLLASGLKSIELGGEWDLLKELTEPSQPRVPVVVDEELWTDDTPFDDPFAEPYDDV